MQLGSLGEHIAKHRWKAGLTIGQLSKSTGVLAEQLDSIEAGAVDVDLLTLNEICCALGVSCQKIIIESESSEESASEEPLCDFPTRPGSLDECRRALNWYRTKKLEYAWKRLVRQRELKKMAERRIAIQAARAGRDTGWLG